MNERKKPTDKAEEMYKTLTGKGVPIKKQLKKILVKIPAVQKLITRNAKPDGTHYFLSLPRGVQVSWFKEHS